MSGDPDRLSVRGLWIGCAARAVFEAALKDFLSVWRTMGGAAPSFADLDAESPRGRKDTMGPLLEKFKKRVTISDESVLVEFAAAVKLRNFLMIVSSLPAWSSSTATMVAARLW